MQKRVTLLFPINIFYCFTKPSYNKKEIYSISYKYEENNWFLIESEIYTKDISVQIITELLYGVLESIQHRS